MIRSRVLSTVSAVSLLTACAAPLEDADLAPARESSATSYDAEESAPPSAASAYDAESEEVGVVSSALTATPEQKALAASVGAKVMDGPAPRLMAKIGGAPFTLIKNWDFGTSGNIRNRTDLANEFNFHDHWGTIANGTNYGSVTAAPTAATAINQSGLGLPNDRQPLEDPARPTWTWTSGSLHAHVRPLSPTQATVSAAKHNVTNGSLTAKWALPKGGSLLGRDIVWESNVRMPKVVRGYWFALWTAGKQWNKGAEMDVLESFGTEWVKGDAFHSDSVGGTNLVDFSNWFSALDKQGVPATARKLTDWHVFTWVYRKNDTYEIYFDNNLVQRGNINWTYTGVKGQAPVDMSFLFDFGWGHTQVKEVNIELPAGQLPLTYDIDYSRVYIR